MGGILAEGRRSTTWWRATAARSSRSLLVDTRGAAALKVAESLRSRVEEHRFEHGGRAALGKLTISVGVATCPDHAKTAPELLQAADAALYRAKNAGRNQVQVATGTAP